jgi:hypothetical protein
MKNITLLFLAVLILNACSGTKRIERNLSSGNYDLAITNALKKLEVNREAKRKTDYIILLQEAYKKVVVRDIERINFLKKDNNPANYEQIYELYSKLNARQESIKPITPLYLRNKEVKLSFKDYSSQIINAKIKASEYLYNNAMQLLSSNNKLDCRKAFNDFEYIERINADYKDVRNRIQEAHDKGTDFVLVTMKNQTQQSIPQRLEDDLLNFSTYGLNDLWTVYHNNKDSKINYDFAMDFNLRDIAISPEQIKEREIFKETQVNDGWKYALDTNGNVLKDSLGNKIKIDKFKTVSCEYYETRQFKVSRILGNVEFKNNTTKQLIEAFPIESEYIFEHFYATSRGDRRALDSSLLGYLNNRSVQFPSNEQMIYDTGEDLKLRLKEIITGHSFRR